MPNYFKEKEFACKCGCGYSDISQELLSRLNLAREEAGVPFIITSGCRCKEHNKAVGGVADSAHTKGLAVDIYAPDATRWHILAALFLYFHRIGISFKGNFIHVDIDMTKAAPVVWEY